MKLYTETEQYKLYEGSMLDMLDVIPENSIDAIVTDPPYELNFMNKGWDRSGIAFQKETWEKCLKVLKPGGYLLSFGGSRTFHRIACAIEDAGFEIRDTVMWLYGCLSGDTEVLTKSGFKLFDDITDEDVIRVYDVKYGWTKWEKPERWNVYHVDNESCYRIKSDLTDQLVSKNHRCLIERDGKLVFEFAENLNSVENVPIILDDSNIYAYGFTSASVTEEIYSGMIFCPTVSTGCFVARRSGKIFITGNSGFPKSMNIGLAVDKKNGVENEIVGYDIGTMPNFRDAGTKNSVNKIGFNDGDTAERSKQPIYKIHNEFEGWGTSLKPAYESVTIARKPCEGSTTDNVLKYGVGGINIDECRVPAKQGEYDIRHYTNEDCFQNLKPKESKFQVKPQPDGRFPANVILTYDNSDFDEVCGGMPNSDKQNGSVTKSTYKNSLGSNGIYGHYSENQPLWESYNDSGSAARYFYCAKASKLDRDEGLDGFVEHSTGELQGGRKEGSAGSVMNPLRPDGHIRNNPLNPYAGAGGIKRNKHPCVKPTSLMQYLVRLVSPKGSTILDPFNGSGSTGKAVMFENRSRNANYKYIGIDLSEEYLQISKARIDYAMVADMTIDETGKVKLDKQNESAKTKLKQINLFEI